VKQIDSGLSRRIGRRLAPVLLLLLSSTVAVAMAEALVRVADPHARDHALPGGFFTIDGALGWRQRPNHTVTHRTRYFAATYATNARGYRDVTRSDRKRPGQTRVVLLGDSQVFGWGVPQGLRFSDLLEARHPELEVWNHGVMGYGLDQQLLDYEQWGNEWNPDAVVLFATAATLRRMDTGYIYRKHKPRFVLDRSGALQLVVPPPNATTWTTIAYRALSHWYLPYFLDRRLEATREILRRNPAWAGTATTGQEPPVSAPTTAVLGRAAEVARGRGHQLLLLVAEVPAATLSSLRQVCAGLGIRVVAPEFPGDRTPFIFGPGDPHWNRRGHDRVAELFWEQWAAADASTVRKSP
jgi:hypothetical protein